MDRTPQLRAALAAATLCLGPALAQAALPVPLSHLTQEGTAATNIPFGRSTPTRVQYVYGASLFSGPVVLTGVQLRPDGGATTGGKTVDCEMSMSTSPAPIVALSPQFALNRGADAVTVLPRQLLTLPSQAVGASPNPFLAAIGFTSPFAYDPAAGDLVLELAVYGQPPGAYSLDATFVCTSPLVPVGPGSCLQASGLPLGVESATTGVQWGRPWVVRAYDADPGSAVLLALGNQESGSWSGMQLPQDLGVVGASGCFLSIDVAASFFGSAAGDGTVTFPFQLPNNPQLLGKWLRFQAATIDPAANALGLVTSQAQKVQVCGWEPVGRVWSSGVTSATGTVEIGLSAVAQFTTQ
ncbi:MAG: hypothetical protein ACON4Z_07445 [Planctomycetota bacterium]